ncbi:MAG TPA: NfeD family protein [Acidimicrobiales bacterium]|jgi:membrane protein implicated in regulation of membrane protease activity|nr:NfeD family protein [Acidimicrobiales bacterium]
MDTPEGWRWIWTIATAVFAVGELASPGSFFLLPFAIGAAVATLLAFLDVHVVTTWLVFLGVSLAAFAALRPVARRVNQAGEDAGVGARRLLGRPAIVLRDIPGHGEVGLVRVDREEWRAESTDGSPVPSGTAVRVADVQGTRVIVVADGLSLPGRDPGHEAHDQGAPS